MAVQWQSNRPVCTRLTSNIGLRAGVLSQIVLFWFLFLKIILMFFSVSIKRENYQDLHHTSSWRPLLRPSGPPLYDQPTEWLCGHKAAY